MGSAPPRLRRILHPPIIIILCCLLFLLPACRAETPVRTGADNLVAHRLDLLKGRRIGLLTNQTGVLSSGTPLVDTLKALGVNVTVLFTPEHGIRGTGAAGEALRDTIDERTGIPVISLYGSRTKPTPAMMEAIDVLVYDLQDVGARFFTYISTMKLAMDAAAEAGCGFVVLDRPDPIGGDAAYGPVMEDSLRSFIGLLPLPVVYGLTCGELARMINGEGWLDGGRRVDLTVVEMEGWRRSMQWAATGLPWIAPSPNMKTPATAGIYPVTCLVEATNLSEGRGTAAPFMLIGAPFVDGRRTVGDLRSRLCTDLQVAETTFTPTASKHAGRVCAGIHLSRSARDGCDPLVAGMTIIQSFRRLYAESLRVDVRMLGRLIGSGRVVQRLLAGEEPSRLQQEWDPALQNFRQTASKYFLYTNF